MKDLGLLNIADVSREDLLSNAATLKANAQWKSDKANVVAWFLPIVTHALKGGVRTVFQFAEMLTQKWGTISVFVIYSHSGKDFDPKPFEDSLRKHFPTLRFVVHKFRHGRDEVTEIPHSDVGICTLWTTAYVLLRYNQTKRKFYFAQDFEPLFYEAGSLYAVIEQTYRLGFSCIANTPGVANRYRIYSDDVCHFLPGIDSSVYFPRDPSPENPKKRIVFYGRPDNPRNCFSLGTLILKRLKLLMKDDVEILSVGAEWDEAEYGLKGVVKNLGLLSSLRSVADLYRSADLGLVFMVTPHPSYQPLEYMACGCIVATNVNEANMWLLNEGNALLLNPLPDVAAREMESLLHDSTRMRALREKGYATVGSYKWSAAFDIFSDRLVS